MAQKCRFLAPLSSLRRCGCRPPCCSHTRSSPLQNPISNLNFPYRRVCLSRACLGKMIVFIQLCINRSKEAFVRYSHRIRMETDPPTSGTVNGTARRETSVVRGQRAATSSAAIESSHSRMSCRSGDQTHSTAQKTKAIECQACCDGRARARVCDCVYVYIYMCFTWLTPFSSALCSCAPDKPSTHSSSSIGSSWTRSRILQKTPLLSQLSYVCPEPVLAKWSLF